MEILVIALVVVGAAYLVLRPKKSSTVAESAPYKVEAPVVDLEPAPVAEQVKPLGDTTSGGGPAVEVQPAKAKTTRKTSAKKAPASKKPRAKKTTTK